MAEVVLPADVKRTILFRQIAFLVGVAASVALGVYVVLWSQTPNYSLLYGSMSDQDVSQVLDSLQKSGIKYRIDTATGAVMVPSSKVHDARMKLAADGLPKSANAGFGILQEEQGIGTSQFIEQARYQHALESELAKTIEKVSSVRSARVHLAISKQSAFIRNRKPTSASVMLDLYSGHQMETEQVAAIANLVAASVPNLDATNVSVVDQFGRLMTQGSGSDELIMSNNQFQYSRRVESSYVKRIEDILAPIVGSEGVKAQVAADFDFTSTEQTREMYNPDLPALRSEQVEEESLQGRAMTGGVPGALSNQPLADGSAPERIPEGGQLDNVVATEASGESSMQRRATRNYELDRTISHTRMPVGSLRRLSVAVLIDYKEGVDTAGKPTRVEHSPEELEQITALVREAIGYNTARGDSVSVMNAEFARPAPIEPLPAEAIWKQPWVWDLAKQVLGAAFVLFLVFGVLRPAIKNLVNKEVTLHQTALAAAGPVGELVQDDSQRKGQQENSQGNDGVAQLSGPKLDNSVEAVKGVVQSDAKLAAQVVKNWVGSDD